MGVVYLFEGVYVLVCLHIILSIRPKWICLIVSGTIMEIISLLTAVYFIEEIKGLIFVFGISIYSYCVLRKKIAFFASVLTLTASLVTSNLSQFLFNIIIRKIKLDGLIIQEWILEAILMFSLMMCFYVICSSIMRRIYSTVEPFFMDMNNKIKNIIVLLTYAVFIISYFGLFYIADTVGRGIYIILLSIVLITVAAIVALINYSGLKQLELKFKDEELNQLNDYMASIEAINQEMRRFRHDYKNVLSSMYSYIKDGDMAGLKEHVETHIIPFEKNIDVEMQELNKLTYIKDKALKGLLSFKLSQGINMMLNVRTTISEDIEYLAISIVDLCRVVGILLDNAMEEASESDEMLVHVLLEVMDEGVIIHIENSLCSETANIDQMFEEGYTTKDGHTGIGLSTVRRILDEIDINLDSYNNNGHFIQCFVVPFREVVEC